MKKFGFSILYFFFLLSTSPQLALGSEMLSEDHPSVSLSFSPTEIFPGETVTVKTTLSGDTPHSYALRWDWNGAISNIRKVSDDSIAYEAQNAPATVSATLWDRLTGKDLEKASLTVTPQNLTVSLSVISKDVIEALVWDEKNSTISTVRGITTNTYIPLSTTVKPAPKGRIRYVWTTNEGTFIASQDNGSCLVYRDSPGTAIASVELLDKNNVVLGKTETSLDVALSAETLERSSRLLKGNEDWKKAQELRKYGNVEEAFVKAQQAAKELARGGVNIATLSEELEQFKATRDNYFKSLEESSAAAALWRDGKLDSALEKYKEAQKLYPQEETQINISRITELLDTNKSNKEKAILLAEEAERLAKEDKLEESLQRYGESLSYYSDPSIRSARAAIEGRFKAAQRRIELAKSLHAIALNLEMQGDLENALSKMAEAREIWFLPEAQKDMQRLENALQSRLNKQAEAALVTHDASVLEKQGQEGQGDPLLLAHALEKYREANRIYPDVSLERSIKRVNENIEQINTQISQSNSLINEAQILENSGRLDEALEKYRHALELRVSADIEQKTSSLFQVLETQKQKSAESQQVLEEALKLERSGNIDSALPLARQAESIFSNNESKTTIKRLEEAIASRNGKITRAKEVADQARSAESAGELEKALDLYLESQHIWKDESLTQTIQVLEGQVAQDRNTEQRSITLYKEAVVLERESKLELAEEKLQASLALKHTSEAELLIAKVQKQRAEEKWVETLQTQPLALTAVPLLPRAGQKTIIRIEGGIWSTDDNLAYRWQIFGNIIEGKTLDGGKAYGFYPADTQPITAVLTVLQKETHRELGTQKISVTALPYEIKLLLDESGRTSLRWNPALKRLEEIPEFATLTNIPIRAEIIPLPEDTVAYFWSADKDSSIKDTRTYETALQRLLPGTAKASVTVKDSRSIVLGTAQLSFIVSIDKNDMLRDIKRSDAWTEWQKASALWLRGQRLEAIEAGIRASLMNPNDSSISNGLVQMKEELGKMEHAARLLSESSVLLDNGKISEAAEKISEAERLWPSETASTMNYRLREAEEKFKAESLQAARLQSEAEAFLSEGKKVDALLRFRSSLLLKDNEAIVKEVLRLEEELKREKKSRQDAYMLREKANLLADKKRYADALELFSQSLKLYPDPALEDYLIVLKERATEEKALKAEAMELKKVGDELLKAKKPEEALIKYTQSLEVWYDEALAESTKKERERLNQAQAAKLRKEAEALVRGKKPQEALKKYQESLKYAYDQAADTFVKKNLAAEAQKRSKILAEEGDLLLKEKKPQEALDRYRAALKEIPQNEELKEKVKKLEMVLTPATDSVQPAASTSGDTTEPIDLVQADALFREGNTLYGQKKYKEALTKYTESYKLSQNQKLKEFIDQLEETLRNVEAASKLVQEGNALYKEQKYKEALAKYQESLKLHPNPEVEAFIPKVEALLK